MKISTTARNAAGDSIVSLIEVGATYPNGYIEIRSGSVPPNPQSSPADGLLLATLGLSSPAFQPFSNGSSIANTIGEDNNIDNTGIASWARFYNKDGGAVFDATITAVGGGGDIQFDSTNFIKGGVVRVNSLTAVMPE